MKLYTEEQVRKAIELAQKCEHDCGGVYFIYDNADEVLEELNPIELPIDEEIKKEAQKQWGNVHRTGVLGFIECAKWLKEQILNQNK